MQFLYPFVLYGLIALAIPLIIHLFNFKRPKRVFFTNVRFLKELKLASKKSSKLKHLIILVLRMLAFAALIFAFSMPVLKKKDEIKHHGNPVIVVYIDNSYSMQAIGSRGMLLEDAVRSATEIARYYDPSDEFYLITNDFSPKYSRIVNRSDFIELITEIDFSPVSRSADEIHERIAAFKQRNIHRSLTCFFISDFQKSTFAFTESTPPDGFQSFLLLLKSIDNSNLYLDSVYMETPVIRPGQIVSFNVIIGNTGDEEVEDIPVTLTLNGREAAVATATVPANGNSSVALTTRIVNEGIFHGEISIDDAPVVFDDKFYIGTNVTKHRKALVLYGDKPNLFINKLFEEDSLFVFDSRPATQIDFSLLNRYDIIFLNELKVMPSGLQSAISNFADDGGIVVVIPSRDPNEVESINSLLTQMGVATYADPDTTTTRTASINFDHHIYKGVYSEQPSNLAMPVVYQHYKVNATNKPGESVIMRLLNDNPLLLATPSGRGMTYLFTSPIDINYTNLPMHAEIFVPPVYNMALYSGMVPPLYYTIGSDISVSIPFHEDIGEATFRIKSLDNYTEFIPGHRNEPFGVLLFFEDQVENAGNYKVLFGEEEIAPLSFNYNHQESDLKCDDEKELQQWLSEEGYNNIQIIERGKKTVTERLSEMDTGVRLWRYFVIAALLFLLLETVLLRFWKEKQVKTT